MEHFDGTVADKESPDKVSTGRWIVDKVSQDEMSLDELLVQAMLVIYKKIFQNT